MRRAVGLAVGLLVFASVLSAENIRGPVVSVYSISDSAGASDAVPLHLEDLIGVTAAPAFDLVTGIELIVESPEAAAKYPGTYALFIYSAVTPVPAIGRLDYRGKQSVLRVLDGHKRTSYLLPFGDTRLASSADAVVLRPAIDPSAYPLLVGILPVMKGIPSDAYRARFTITAKPVFKNKGRAEIRIASADGTPKPAGTVVFVNEQALVGVDAVVLDPGMHRVRAEAPGFAPESVSFLVERGKTILVDLRLRRAAGSLNVEAPAGAKAFLNGMKIETGKTLSVEPGEHTLVVVIGDYQVTKRISVLTDKTYTASVFFDILVRED